MMEEIKREWRLMDGEEKGCFLGLLGCASFFVVWFLTAIAGLAGIVRWIWTL